MLTEHGKEVIKTVADFIHTHANHAYSDVKDGVMGICCGCKKFLPLVENSKEGVDYVYSQHLAEALYNEGLIYDE